MLCVGHSFAFIICVMLVSMMNTDYSSGPQEGLEVVHLVVATSLVLQGCSIVVWHYGIHSC